MLRSKDNTLKGVSWEELEQLKEQLTKSRQEAENNLAGWKRSKADYINLQRETEKNRQDWVNFASLELIKDLIPIWENFDKLVSNLPKNLEGSWTAGLNQLQKMIIDFFRKNGVERLKTQGEKFDPEWHEAVAKEKKEGVLSGQIVKEISSGYKMNNKLIIPPKVIVGE